MRAFSTTEFVVAAAIGLSVVLTAGFAVYKNSTNIKLADARSDLLREASTLQTILQQEVGLALKVNGYSNRDFPGIANPSTTAPNSTVITDEILIYRAPYPDLGARVSVTMASANPLNPGNPRARFDRNQRFNANSENFLDSALTNRNYFAISKSSSINILQKQARLANELVSGVTRYVLELRLPSTANSFQLSELQGDAMLTPVEQVRLKIENGSELVRTSDISGDRRVLHSRVKKFLVNYFFADQGDTVTNPCPPNLGLRHILDSVYLSGCTGQTPVTWADVQRIEVQVQLEFSKAFPNVEDRALEEDGFSLESGHLVLSKTLLLTPFVGQFSDEQAQGFDVACNPRQLQSRCKPECAEEFNSPSPGDIDWEGYKPGSDYCTCTNNGAQNLVMTGFPNWPWDEPRAQACYRLYGCNLPTYNPWTYPAATLQCQCLQNPTAFESNRTIDRAALDDLLGRATSGGTLTSAEDDQFSCTRPFTYNNCDTAVRMELNLSGASNLHYPWINHCRCKTGPNIPFNAKMYGSICDVDNSHVCTNTVNPLTSAYKLVSQGFADGLTEEEAQTCACIKAAGETNPRQDGFGLYFIDARGPTAPGAPGPSSSISSNYVVQVGAGSETRGPVVCANLLCGLRYHSVNCCVSDVGRDFSGRAALAANPFRFYCDGRCNSAFNATAAQIDSVRRTVVGLTDDDTSSSTPITGALPNWCGGGGSAQQ